MKTYPKYKDSNIPWIGRIPQDWKILTLKRIFSNRDGGAWGEDSKNNANDRICIRIADFDYPKMTIKHGINYTVRNYTTDVIDRLTLQKNDILIEKSGGGEQTPVGRTIIFTDSFNALYANFMDRLRVRQNTFLPKFIHYFLVSLYQNGITYQYIKQTTGIQNLDLTNLLAKENIALPALEEQTTIAAYLDRKCSAIERVIEAESHIIEKLREYRQSLITEAVSHGLNPHAPMKASGIPWIGRIPGHWNILKTLYVLLMPITDGPHTTPVHQETGIPFISAEAISCGNGSIDFSHIWGYISQEFYDECCKKYKPEINDIYMIKSGATTGKVAIVDTNLKFNIWSPLAVFRCDKSKVNFKYLFYFIQSDAYQKQIENSWTFGTQQNIGMRTLEKLKICFPPISEQKSIADFLDKKCSAIDSTISKKQQIIEKMTEYKKSLIYECVTGKLSI